MNPFDTGLISRAGTYKEFVESQISDSKVGESRQVNFGDKKIADFRMNLWKVASECGMKFKTAVTKDGELWVKRVE